MTEQLRDLLHERAGRPDFAVPDVAALVRAGEQRVRRRRAVVAGGTLAAAVVVAGLVAGATAWLGPDADGPGRGAGVVAGEGPASAGAEGAALSWVLDGELRTPGSSTPLGFDLVAYTRTAAGFVALAADGTVHRVDGGGTVTLGRAGTGAPAGGGTDDRVVGDPAGELAAWFDPARGALVVVDVGSERVVESRTTSGPVEVLALDGDRVWYQGSAGRDTGPVEVLDVGTGRTGEAARDLELRSVRAGVLAWTGPPGTVLDRPDGSSVTLEGMRGDLGALSPDGRWYSADADEPQVHDTRSGARVELATSWAFATGYEWLDAGTLAVIASREVSGEGPDGSAPVELLACEVPAGSCTAVAELPPFAELEERGFVLPVGLPMG